MAKEIIDITRYFKREPDEDVPRGAMALWGAEGERSRFALPLWRIIHLARADRALIVWCDEGPPRMATPFVALDLGADPARTDVSSGMIPLSGPDDPPGIIDRDQEGLVVHLGSRRGRVWTLLADGGSARTSSLTTRAREDILFLAGECAGLLFLRELADDADAFADDE